MIFGGGVAQEITGWILVAIRMIQEFLKGFFIYYCDSYRQPRIKRKNPRPKFELPEFSVQFLLLLLLLLF